MFDCRTHGTEYRQITYTLTENNRCSFGVRYDNDVYQQRHWLMRTASGSTFNLTQRFNQLDKSEKDKEEVLEALCKSRSEIADALTIVLMKTESLQEDLQSKEESQDDDPQVSPVIDDVLKASRLMQRRIKEMDSYIQALRDHESVS